MSNVATGLKLLSGWRGYGLAFTLGLLIGGAGAGYGAKVYYERDIAKINETHAAADKLRAEMALAKEMGWRDLVAALDQKHTKELADVEARNAKIVDDLRAGNRRLSVRVTACTPLSAAAAASGVDDGTGRADIDARDAGALGALTRRGDRAIVKMTALQAYARICSQNPSNLTMGTR